MKRHGFTLIELLVVIAIIAILAAILFPVFARARAKAQQSNCLSNVKQIALGIIMYTSDNNERYPLYRFTDSAGHFYCWWNGVDPYVKNMQLWKCPSDATTGMIVDDPAQIPPSYGRSYAGNPNVMNTNGTSTGSIVAPAQCIMTGEAPQRLTGYWQDPSTYILGSTIDWAATNQSGTKNYWRVDDAWYESMIRHNDGENLGFCDGHAKWAALNAIPRADSGKVWNGVTFGIWWDINAS
ncbi:MAG TPA: prepilin-type N-terminal cleavage/methylation domain-containing protein [Armatimonadota bacterium]|jgi:prepilin-type N-terminal cleavage/methylation domain-containing protein/prepilin-type processing-associated H-X9-DG protein